jgi:glycosyltransferase involved in cell wall biosynthesis
MVFAARHPLLALAVGRSVLRGQRGLRAEVAAARQFVDRAARTTYLKPRLKPGEIALFDEGLAHRAINLFSSSAPGTAGAVRDYLWRIPPPDLLVYVDAGSDVSYGRLLRRGLPKAITGREPAAVQRYLEVARAISEQIRAELGARGVTLIRVQNDELAHAAIAALRLQLERLPAREHEPVRASGAARDGPPASMANGHERRRVLQVISNLDVGGAQSVVLTLTRYLPDAGWEPVVATFSDGPLRREIEHLGVVVEVLGARRHSILSGVVSARELWRIRRQLTRLVQDHHVAVIQTHLLRSLDFLVLSLRWQQPVKAVFWTFHNSRLALRRDQVSSASWTLPLKRLAYRTLYRVSGRLVAGYIAVSHDVATALERDVGVPRHAIRVIENAVDMDRFAGPVDRAAVRERLRLPAEATVMIVVAKLLPQKGHGVLLDALPEIYRRHPALHVILAGDGDLRAPLERRVAAMGLSERVHFVGNRADVPELLRASDVFVLPSLWEGLPMALLEAMAAALPVVATEVSGTRQVIVDRESGLLVPPGRAGDLAAAILELLGGPDRARALGIAARARVEGEFSARAQARRHAELYAEALGLEPLRAGTNAPIAGMFRPRK